MELKLGIWNILFDCKTETGSYKRANFRRLIELVKLDRKYGGRPGQCDFGRR